MYVQQSVFILFFLRRSKMRKDGKCPVCVRLTIDGLKEEFSTGVKVNTTSWNDESKEVQDSDPDYKNYNKKLRKIETDLERLVDLVQAKDEIATPEKVVEAYKTPIRGAKVHQEKEKNQSFNQAIDEAIQKYLDYYHRYEKAHEDGKIPALPLEMRLGLEKEEVTKLIEKLAKEGKVIFDDKTWEKTLVLAINEHLLNFMEISFAGHRSPNTLEKMWGRKKRYVDFLEYRYEKSDIALSHLQYKFMDELLKYNMVQHGIIENSAMKYVQILKGIISRVESLGWIQSNQFDQYRCSYTDPHTDWLTMEEMIDLMETDFQDDHLNEVRDIFIFQSFTGLSYAELRSLGPDDIREGIDGKRWISKFRQKTDGDETLPMLPTAVELIEKYKHHRVSLRRRKLFPVPCNVEYNRALKVIARTKGYKINLRSHKARYFYANVVMFDNGVSLKTIAATLGQKTTRSTEKYVKANKSVISQTMNEVEEKLYGSGGRLNQTRRPKVPTAKVISIGGR